VDHPQIWQPVLDCVDARALAEFYRQVLGLVYRPGDEPPTDGPDLRAEVWLALRHPDGRRAVAFQPVPGMPVVTWPDGPHPQMMHLDLWVGTVSELDEWHTRIEDLGGRLLQDHSDDPEEPLRVYADPAGHPFCLFVASP
jgi:hypothetical protein